MKRIFALATVLLAISLPAARAISWPLYKEGGATWVTEQPHTEDTFPGADLMVFMQSGVNVLGESISPCVNSGKVCTDAVGDALCKLLGYDELYDMSVTQAATDEAVRELSSSATPNYCLREGVHASGLPDDLASMPGNPCLKIDRLACTRRRESMVAVMNSLDFGGLNPETKAKPASATETLSTLFNSLTEKINQAVESAKSGGNRKLRLL